MLALRAWMNAPSSMQARSASERNPRRIPVWQPAFPCLHSGLGWRAGLDERAIFHASPKRERGTALRSLPLASTGHWQRRRVESLFQHAGVLPTDPLELLLCGWERTGGKVAGHRAADERVVGPERVPEP